MTYATCPQCGGEGKVVSNPCGTCKGSGLLRKKETVRFHIPAGVENGMQLTLQGEGHSAPRGGVNGDLLVVIEELAHPQFKRDGANLFYTRVISVTDAILGCEISIPCIGGAQTLKIDAGTQSGTVLRMRGKGLPDSYGRNGDLYVKILVWIPRKLRGSDKEAVERLSASESIKPDPSREDRALFEKESQYF
jgi:molecular chaperone DnaJ